MRAQSTPLPRWTYALLLANTKLRRGTDRPILGLAVYHPKAPDANEQIVHILMRKNWKAVAVHAAVDGIYAELFRQKDRLITAAQKPVKATELDVLMANLSLVSLGHPMPVDVGAYNEHTADLLRQRHLQ